MKFDTYKIQFVIHLLGELSVKQLLAGILLVVSGAASAQTLEQYPSFEIPITPFANMASGYQATNPGFRAILRSEGGDFLAGGYMNIDAVMNGTKDDASRGSPYGRLILKLEMRDANPSIVRGGMQGTFRGKLSICMAENQAAPLSDTTCKSLSGNIHPERPFQWINKDVEFRVTDSNIMVTRFFGSTGDGGTSEQLSLAVFHPAYSFAAPGKAFKDFQSPLVLDLSGDGLDLVNVWDDFAIHADLNGTGTKVRTGWVKPSDAFLAWDYDHTGTVTGPKLLGEYTKTIDGKKTFENGFQALAQLDANKDGEVSGKEMNDLLIWQDMNQNGTAEKDEVRKASAVAQSLSLASKKGPSAMLEDNEVRLVSTFVDVNGKKKTVGDVWFKQRRNEAGVKSSAVNQAPASAPAPVSKEKFVAKTDQMKQMVAQTQDDSVYPVSIDVTRKERVSIGDFTGVKTYASTNNFYHIPQLRAGMPVFFSASYGVGGEAGQAKGVLVEKDGKLVFKQTGNPTNQLLLAPGNPFNSSSGATLWDMTDYVKLVNRVVFSDPNESSRTAFDVYPTAGLEVYKVDFRGGTAGGSVDYTDALEVTMKNQESNTEVKVYYGQGVGPVALEFREASSPSGTFKVYIGAQ